MKILLTFLLLGSFCYAQQREVYPIVPGGSFGGLTKNITYVEATGTPVQNGIALTNAAKNITLPGLLVVGPGKYYTALIPSPSPFARSGLDSYWYPGASWGIGDGLDVIPTVFGGETAVTTNAVYGYGEFYLTNDASFISYLDTAGSKLHFEANIVAVNGSGSSPFQMASGTEMNIRLYDHGYSYPYDFIWGNGANSKLYLEAPRIFHGEDLVEFGDFPSWGSCIVNIGYALRTNDNGSRTSALIGGRMMVSVQKWEICCDGSIAASSLAGTNALIQNSWIMAYETNKSSVLSSGSLPNSSFYLKNVRLTGSTNLDPISVTNATTAPPLTLENCNIDVGWAATNWARSGAGAQSVKILGSLSLSRPVPIDPLITISGPLPTFQITNIVNAVYTSGTYTNKMSDERVLMPNGTARTNRLLSVIGMKGRSVTIVDIGKTASGTNIWFYCEGSDTIGTGGPTRTNVVTDGGSMTIFSDGTVWNITSKFP